MAPPLPLRDSVRGWLTQSARAVSASLTRLTAALPFSGGVQSPPSTPTIQWYNDQPSPPPPGGFIAGYHDHTYRAFAQPTNYDGFTLDRARRGVSLHRQGIFYESSMLSVAMCGFGPILAALGRRMSFLRLPKHVTGGTRGLSRIVAEDLESQLAPKRGLAPSPYFPESTYGGIVFDKATMNFFVLQHVAGPEDPMTGHRMIYTRRWPTWAVVFNPWRHTFQAQTDTGPVDILNDGKFTLGADVDDPHLTAAVVALGEEAVDGKQTQRARASWIKMYGNPKWWGEMPPDITPDSLIGRALFTAIGTVRNQDGFGVGPNGAKLDIKGLTTGQSDGFGTALASNMAIVAMIIDGSDGPAAPSGTGVYPSPHKFATANAMNERDVVCVNRAVNVGHVKTYLETNYSAGLAEEKERAAEEEALAEQGDAGAAPGPIDKAKARGIWTDPVFEIGPLPDPLAESRHKSQGEAQKAYYEALEAERNAGGDVDQPRANALAEWHGATPLVLGSRKPRILITDTDRAKTYRVDEVRAGDGYDAIGDDRGNLTIAELDAISKAKAASPPQEGTAGATPSATPAQDSATRESAATGKADASPPDQETSNR